MDDPCIEITRAALHSADGDAHDGSLLAALMGPPPTASAIRELFTAVRTGAATAAQRELAAVLLPYTQRALAPVADKRLRRCFNTLCPNATQWTAVVRKRCSECKWAFYCSKVDV